MSLYRYSAAVLDYLFYLIGKICGGDKFILAMQFKFVSHSYVLCKFCKEMGTVLVTSLTWKALGENTLRIVGRFS